MPTVSKGEMRFFKIRAARLMRAVPTLDLRRKQLNREIFVWEEELKRIAQDYERLSEMMASNPHPEVDVIVDVEKVEMKSINVAGVMLEKMARVIFKPIRYSFFATPPSVDEFVTLKMGLIETEAKLQAKRKALGLLAMELAITTQRINLFEKRLIPGYLEKIRYIRGRLEDNERATVMVAKIAQAGMLSEQYAAETA